jgi:hypothetical protein
MIARHHPKQGLLLLLLRLIKACTLGCWLLLGACSTDRWCEGAAIWHAVLCLLLLLLLLAAPVASLLVLCCQMPHVPHMHSVHVLKLLA